MYASRQMSLLLIALVLALAGSACSPLGLVNTLSPSRHYERVANVAYGSHARHRLDVYLPHGAGSIPKSVSASQPLVVFFYGGGWKSGDRADYEFVASSLTKAGFAVVIPDYRLFPEVVFPAFIEDGASAVAWAFREASAYGFDTEQIYIMGHSAGAHLAALLATDQQYLAEHGHCTESIRGLIALSGPYDFLPINSSYLVDLFPEHLRRDSQPINFVSERTPPTLLLHGAEDDVVDAQNSQTLAKLLKQHNVSVDLKVYEKEGHASVAAALAPPLDFTGDTLEDTLAFLRHARTPGGNCR